MQAGTTYIRHDFNTISTYIQHKYDIKLEIIPASVGPKYGANILHLTMPRTSVFVVPGPRSWGLVEPCWSATCVRGVGRKIALRLSPPARPSPARSWRAFMYIMHVRRAQLAVPTAPRRLLQHSPIARRSLCLNASAMDIPIVSSALASGCALSLQGLAASPHLHPHVL